MKFVLIVVLAAGGGTGLGMWQQPGIALQEFDDRAACEQAQATVERLVKQSRLEYASVKASCVPKASEPAAPK